MAIMNSFWGSCSGRIGDNIYYQRNGKTCVRSGPRKTKSTATPKQIAQRAKFALVMAFLNPLRSFFQNAAPIKNGKITLFNWAVQQALRHSVIGTFPDFQIDYSTLKISYGSLSILHNLGFAACIMGRSGSEDALSPHRQVKLTWAYIEDGFYISGNDLVRIVLYNVNSKTFSFHEDSFRSDEQVVIDVPGALAGDILHVYAFTESRSGQRSDSRYAGEIEME